MLPTISVVLRESGQKKTATRFRNTGTGFGWCLPCSCGVAGELSPAAVSPYVLAGDGSYVGACWSLADATVFSTEGRATLLEAASPALTGVAGKSDMTSSTAFE